MDITFLGTASAYPSPSRGASCIVFRNDGVHWMFDCGEGSQIQLMKSSLRPGKISKIFISHLHGDHVFGLPGLMCTISQNFSPENKETLEIYGPVGLRKLIRVALELSRSQLGYNYCVHELVPIPEQLPPDWKEWSVDGACSTENLHPNESLGKRLEPDTEGVWHVCDTDRMTVTAGALKHRIPSFGFVIQEKPTPGKLDVSILKARGVPPGPLYAKIKNGEVINAPDGSTINPKDVVGPEKEGRKVVILGDTCDSQQMAGQCKSADVIIHECTLENEMKENAIEKGHSTPEMAGVFAREIAAKCLLLTHFSQRYKPQSMLKESKEEEDLIEKILNQAREAFGSDKVFAAEDLWTYQVANKK